MKSPGVCLRINLSQSEYLPPKRSSIAAASKKTVAATATAAASKKNVATTATAEANKKTVAATATTATITKNVAATATAIENSSGHKNKVVPRPKDLQPLETCLETYNLLVDLCLTLLARMKGWMKIPKSICATMETTKMMGAEMTQTNG